MVALLLTQRLVDTGAPPLKAAEFWSLVDAVADLGALLGTGPDEVSRTAQIDQSAATRIVTLLDAATSFAFALDDAQQGGLSVFSALSERFPTRLRERLGKSAPPLLYALGDTDLLADAGLGIVGSRAVSEAGAELAKDAAATAVNHGLGVISGGAKGTDLLAMNAAVDAGGTALGVLADSL
ncbi:MAG: DNA-processing protein DprA, partial [Acidimicrobiales bacterium]